MFAMQPLHQLVYNTSVENIYDQYADMLYGIALQIAPDEILARQILIATFIKVHRQKITDQKHPALCILLIKLIIETARELLKGNTQFILKQFEKTPMLHKILCVEDVIEEIGRQHQLTTAEIAKKIREEITVTY